MPINNELAVRDRFLRGGGFASTLLEAFETRDIGKMADAWCKADLSNRQRMLNSVGCIGALAAALESYDNMAAELIEAFPLLGKLNDPVASEHELHKLLI